MATLTLAEAARLSQDHLQRGVIETFVQESPVLDRIPFMTIEGNAYAYNKEEKLPGVAFRNVNEAYPESTGTVVQETESLSILGGDADVDRFIVKTRGDLNNQRAIQTRMKVKSLSLAFQHAFIHGDSADASAPLAWDGLDKRLVAGGDQRLTSEVLNAGTTDDIRAVLADDAATFKFFDELDALAAQVDDLSGGNGAFYVNRQMLHVIRSAGRRIGGTEMVQEDMTGKRVLQWQGIPVLDLGNSYPAQKAGSTGKRHSLSTTPIVAPGQIWAVRFGLGEEDGAVTGLTNGGVDVMDLGQIDEKPVYRTRIEFYSGLATFGDRAAAVLEGVGAADGTGA